MWLCDNMKTPRNNVEMVTENSWNTSTGTYQCVPRQKEIKREIGMGGIHTYVYLAYL